MFHPIRKERRFEEFFLKKKKDSRNSKSKEMLGSYENLVSQKEWRSNKSSFHPRDARHSMHDYEKFDNLEDVSFGFQSVYPVSFDIKNLVLTSLRNNHVYREVNFYTHRFANMRITSGDGWLFMMFVLIRQFFLADVAKVIFFWSRWS